MLLKISKNIKKIYTAFSKIDGMPKNLIKFGSWIFMAIFALGAFLMLYHRVVLSYDSYFEFISTQIIRSSFILLAEFLIGGLLIDYVFKKI